MEPHGKHANFVRNDVIPQHSCQHTVEMNGWERVCASVYIRPVTLWFTLVTQPPNKKAYTVPGIVYQVQFCPSSFEFKRC